MTDIVERLRGLHVKRHPSRSVVECDETTILEAAARIEKLESEIKTAIRQFEDGNRLECHRTLCTVIYGKQY